MHKHLTAERRWHAWAQQPPRPWRIGQRLYRNSLMIDDGVAYLGLLPFKLNLWTAIDLADLPLVQRFNWRADVGRRGRIYARCDEQPRVMLHRLLMGTPDGYDTDHIDHNTLNNVRSNLRIVTHAQNQQNLAGPRLANPSGVRGVSRHTNGWGKFYWRASVNVGGHQYHRRFPYTDEGKQAAIEAVHQMRAEYMPHSTN